MSVAGGDGTVFYNYSILRPHAVSFTSFSAEGKECVSCIGSQPPAEGDWVVDKNSYCVNSTVYLSEGSDLVVQGNNSLGLHSSVLVLDGGGILLDGSLTLGDANVSLDRSLRSFLANYSYDENGNLVSDLVHSYEYNDANKLSLVRNASDNSTIAKYFYDHSGNRIKKIIYLDTGTKTIYSFDKLFETVVYSNGTEKNTSFYYANNELVARSEDGVKYFYHNDHLESNVFSANNCI
ncbi:MAG: hypothetical protein U9M95_02175 [Candidatus Altiarchaeota archaeon]|nr:hypothetical protein [Candidatus Altiarchaeota archaeon]